MHDQEDSPGKTPEMEDVRILIVEDEALTAEDLRHTLMGFGYRISPGMDVELGLLYGRVDPTLSSGVLTLGFTTRF